MAGDFHCSLKEQASDAAGSRAGMQGGRCPLPFFLGASTRTVSGTCSIANASNHPGWKKGEKSGLKSKVNLPATDPEHSHDSNHSHEDREVTEL